MDEAYAIAAQSTPGSPIAAALDPLAAWTPEQYMLASVEYSLRWLHWAQTEDGPKGRNRPEPLPTPASKQAAEREPSGPRMSKDELDAYMAAPRVELQAVVHSANKLPADKGAPQT